MSDEEFQEELRKETYIYKRKADDTFVKGAWWARKLITQENIELVNVIKYLLDDYGCDARVSVERAKEVLQKHGHPWEGRSHG